MKISYIFGNHDNYRELEAKIKERIECSKPNLESHESHIKSKNTIHLHGDLQADMAFRGTSDKIKAIFRGNVSIHMGAMTREDVGRSKDEPLYKLGIEDSLWRSVTDKPGKVRNFAKKQFSRIKNALDEPISSRVTPLDQVMKAIHDTIKTQQPELLDGVKNIVLGHYHPPGKPILEYEGIKFIFTGPSTLFSKGPAYSFSIDEEGKFDDFQAIELSRHLGARGGGGSLAR